MCSQALVHKHCSRTLVHEQCSRTPSEQSVHEQANIVQASPEAKTLAHMGSYCPGTGRRRISNFLGGKSNIKLRIVILRGRRPTGNGGFGGAKPLQQGGRRPTGNEGGLGGADAPPQEVRNASSASAGTVMRWYNTRGVV